VLVDDLAPEALMEALQGVNLTFLRLYTSLQKGNASCTIPDGDCHGMEIRHGHIECCTRNCNTRRRNS
jgi:hypothetical protein